MIRGISAAVEALEIGGRISAAMIMKTAGLFATLVTVTHSPSILAHAGSQAARSLIDKINQTGLGLDIGETDFRQVVEELKTPGSDRILDHARRSLEVLAPALEELANAYDDEN